MNFDILMLCCNFLFIIANISKNKPSCHFLLIVIVIAVMLIYAEFFKNMEKSEMLFRIGFVKLLIFHLFSKVIHCNAEVIYGDCKN